MQLSAGGRENSSKTASEGRAMQGDVLTQFQHQHDLILNAIGIGIEVVNEQGLIVFANPAAARLLGWPLAELIGQPAHRISHHTKADGTPYLHEECRIAFARRDGVVYHGDDEIFWRRDGTSFPVAYTSTPLRDDTGQSIGTVLSFQDITARKQAEGEVARLYQQQAQRQEEVRTLLEINKTLGQVRELPTLLNAIAAEAARLLAVPSVIFRLREGAELPVVAARGLTGTGVARGSLQVGESLSGWVVATGEPLIVNDITLDERMAPESRRAALRRGHVAHMGVPLRLGDEVIGVMAFTAERARPFTEQDQALAVAFVDQAAIAVQHARLYQEAQEAYRQLTRAQEQFVQAQKMEAVGRLAGGVAHDFNNLLTVITGRIQLQLMRLPAAHPMRRDLDLMQSAADRAATLTRQLLAFSRQQLLQPQVLDLNALVHEISQLLRRVIGEDIALVTVLDPTLGQVRADPGQLGQVLLNLALNARDAMPRGGQLTIETANVAREEDDKRNAPRIPPGQYVQLRVSDTGVGMDTTVQAHLFEPFFTTKEVGKGTGLGLATVYGIVTQSGGHISVDSALGRGTTFLLSLPCVDEDPAASLPGQTPTALTCEPATVLVVEDETDVRELAADILLATGYRVLSAQSGAEALQRCEQHPEGIDLLLTDVVMPGMSGRELAVQVRQRWPQIKVLYMSGYTDEILGRYGAVDPSLAFVEKPFAPESLTRKVREVLLADRSAYPAADGGLDVCKEY